MRSLGTGDMVYVFMGESLLHVKVRGLITHYDGNVDHQRFEAADEDNTYCFYTNDAYLTKEEAIGECLTPSVNSLSVTVVRMRLKFRSIILDLDAPESRRRRILSCR